MNQAAPHPNRSFWKNVFLSPREARLRAGWRLAIQTVLLLILWVGSAFPISMLYTVFHLKITSATYLALSTLIELLGITASVYLARRFLDHRSFTSLGLALDRRLLPDLLAGGAITFIMMGALYLAMRALGWIQFLGYAWPFHPLPEVVGQTLLYFIILVFVGWQEELLSRGYHLQTIASGINLFWGVMISALIFAALHVTNPYFNLASLIGIFLAGLFLAFAYLRTGRLWLSIGLHIGWNFFEGVVFGFPVSGIATFPLIRLAISGPPLWSGGAFGPEAGLILLPALLIGALLVDQYARRRIRSVSETHPTLPTSPAK
ncbi:MAG TPA: type II CAAX endopeptidase family protein [Anaerolineales bacterium]|nr:type II CAAX endopeptidase family protein [Anaerolineales bacterium]